MRRIIAATVLAITAAVAGLATIHPGSQHVVADNSAGILCCRPN